MFYTLDINYDKLLIKNKNLNPLIVSLHKKDSCDDSDYIEIFTDKCINNIDTIYLPEEDGIYKLTISSLVDNIQKKETIKIPKYEQLLLSLTENIIDSVCGSKCNTCNDCGDNHKNKNLDCENKLKTLIQLLSFYTLSHKQYQPYFEVVFNEIQCIFLNANKCAIIHEKIHGSSNNKKILNTIIATFYLAFFYAQYNNTENKELIKNKFNYNKVISCLNNLGLNLDNIIKKLKDMGKLIIINEEKQYTFEDCISLKSTELIYNDRVIRGKNYNNEVATTKLKIVNKCSKSFILDRRNLFTDTTHGGSFTASINTTVVPANSEIEVPIYYNGIINNTENNISYHIIVNDSQATYNLNLNIEDRPPVTRNNTIRNLNRINEIINKDDLIYSDPDGDPITRVKFTGNVQGLYTDSQFTTPYIAGTELPISFILHFKADDVDNLTTHEYTYQVYANNKWSDD